MHSWGTFPILYVCQRSAVLPYISLISLSIGSYLELAIFREDFSSVASVNVRFSWVFYFVFICSGYILNSPHYIMGGMPRPVFIRGFPDFLKSRFSSRILVCWISWGRERRIILKRFVTVVAWNFLKISCCNWICRPPNSIYDSISLFRLFKLSIQYSVNITSCRWEIFGQFWNITTYFSPIPAKTCVYDVDGISVTPSIYFVTCKTLVFPFHMLISATH